LESREEDSLPKVAVASGNAGVPDAKKRSQKRPNQLGSPTVRVIDRETVPPGPVQVRVRVKLPGIGATRNPEPEAGRSAAMSPAEQEVAPVVAQVTVADSPMRTFGDESDTSSVGGSTAG
jgi:hypothetical protein